MINYFNPSTANSRSANGFGLMCRDDIEAMVTTALSLTMALGEIEANGELRIEDQEFKRFATESREAFKQGIESLKQMLSMLRWDGAERIAKKRKSDVAKARLGSPRMCSVA